MGYMKPRVLRCIRVLKRECPLDVAVRIRTLPQAEINKHHPDAPRGVWGDCHINDSGVGVIRLSRDASQAVMLDTLLHEWAHLHDKGPPCARDDHRVSWGEAYSKVYRAWIDSKEAAIDD